MDTSLWATYFSWRTAQDKAYVKRPEALLRMVFEVTEVMCKLVLNVNWARNHSGATCQRAAVLCFGEKECVLLSDSKVRLIAGFFCGRTNHFGLYKCDTLNMELREEDFSPRVQP